LSIAATILTAALGLGFVAGGLTKVAGVAAHRTTAARLGYSYPVYRGIGAVETAGGAGLLIGLAAAPLGVAAAGGLVLLMIGAAISHARVRDQVGNIAPSVVFALLTGTTLALQLASA
jgi:uncharacterized membrane protein YphA (DoxX/SURF4 family)